MSLRCALALLAALASTPAPADIVINGNFHTGDEDTLRAAAGWLTADWLLATRQRLRDDALIFQRIAFFPDVAERAAITDVILPLG